MIIKLNNKIHNNTFLSFFILFLSGVFSAFSLPPYNLIFINFFIYPILFLFLILFKKDSLKLFLLGLVFGFGFFLSNLYWITNSLTFESEFKFLIPIALIFIPLFLSIFYGLKFFILSFFNLNKNFSSLLTVGLIFSFVEFVRGTIFTGFPWNLIVFSLSSFDKILQILSFTGTYLLNLFCITIFLLPTIVFFKISRILKFSLLLLFLGIIFVINIFGNHKIENFKQIEARKLQTIIKIISPKIKLDRYFSNEDPIKKIKEIIVLSKPDKMKNTLFVYPEGILAGLYLNDLKNYQYLIDESFSEKHKIILGVNSLEDGKVFNTLVFFDNKLNILHKYKKNKLVPFGEFLPFENTLKMIGFKKITQGYKSFSPSKQRDLINFNNFKILPLICYEIIYSGNLSRNLDFDFVINISEDGWFGNSIGPYQHFIHSKFRSIEEGKNIIRSSNNGYSGLISPIGGHSKLIKSTASGVITLDELTLVDKTFFSFHGNKIFFYFNLIYISLIFFLKRKEL